MAGSTYEAAVVFKHVAGELDAACARLAHARDVDWVSTAASGYQAELATVRARLRAVARDVEDARQVVLHHTVAAETAVLDALGAPPDQLGQPLGWAREVSARLQP